MGWRVSCHEHRNEGRKGIEYLQYLSGTEYVRAGCSKTIGRNLFLMMDIHVAEKTERNFHHPLPAMSPARPAAFPGLFLP
ncbi:hypothetical protein AGR8A_Cc40608 [Agrobacterium fabrum str. J-07]|nr:hypothetical protein AGR8A_Cc40608 [Agrobacterium fabrum str. J-07]